MKISYRYPVTHTHKSRPLTRGFEGASKGLKWGFEGDLMGVLAIGIKAEGNDHA